MRRPTSFERTPTGAGLLALTRPGSQHRGLGLPHQASIIDTKEVSP